MCEGVHFFHMPIVFSLQIMSSCCFFPFPLELLGVFCFVFVLICRVPSNLWMLVPCLLFTLQKNVCQYINRPQLFMFFFNSMLFYQPLIFFLQVLYHAWKDLPYLKKSKKKTDSWVSSCIVSSFTSKSWCDFFDTGVVKRSSLTCYFFSVWLPI